MLVTIVSRKQVGCNLPKIKVKSDGIRTDGLMFAKAYQCYNAGVPTQTHNVNQLYKDGHCVKKGQLNTELAQAKAYGQFGQVGNKDLGWQYTQHLRGFPKEWQYTNSNAELDLDNTKEVLIRLLYAKGYHATNKLYNDVLLAKSAKKTLNVQVNAIIAYKDVNNIIKRIYIREIELENVKQLDDYNYNYFFTKQCLTESSWAIQNPY